MPAALSASQYVYEGIWTNWNRGPVLGSTLTVNAYSASILSPALAIVISVAGSQLWRLFQFVLHQMRATSSDRSLIYHQHQVILRNTATDLNALWAFIRTAFAWRHQKEAKVLKATLPLLFCTVIHLVLIILLGIFSSWLLEADDEVLSRSPWCGTFYQTYIDAIYTTDGNDVDAVRKSMEYGNYINEQYGAIQQHVDICRNSVEGCDVLPTKKLTWTSSIVPKGCPFDPTICHPDIDGSISFDTGFLSSDTHLGFNAKGCDRIVFRMTAQCAPLDDAKYSTTWQNIPVTENLPAHQAADALYGASATNARNATYSVTRQYLECDQRAITPPYSLNSEFALPGGNTSAGTATFDPIEELQLLDADTSLVMLSSIAAYSGPVSDPWFSAQQVVNETNAFCLQEQKTLYIREQPLTTIGCIQQWQICNTDSTQSSKCTPLQSVAVLQSSIDDLDLSPKQKAIAARIIDVAYGASFYYVVNSLAQSTSSPLEARNLISATIGLPLPDKQWQTETKYWVEILLAYLQQASLDFSTGQFAASTDYINVAKYTGTDPVEDAAHWLCQNQIIHSRSYRNFNFFALLLTVVVCIAIIVLGLSIEDVIGHIRQRNLRYSGANGKQDMWIANSDLEMLRTIDEVKNGGIWSRSKNGVPLGPPGYKVSIQDLKNESLDVEKGTGIVNLAVKRVQTGIDERRQAQRPPEHDLRHKRCATCSTFELSPTRNASGAATPARLLGAREERAVQARGQPFAFSSTFSPELPQDSAPQQKAKGQYHVLGHSVPPSAESSETTFEHPYEHSIRSCDDVETLQAHAETPPSPENASSDIYRHSPNVAFNRRTQALAQVYESPSPYMRDQKTLRPSSGWGGGVLPSRMSMSGLWSNAGSGWRRHSRTEVR